MTITTQVTHQPAADTLQNRLGLVLAATVCFPVAARPAESLFGAAAFGRALAPDAALFAAVSVAFFGVAGLAMLALAALPRLAGRAYRLALALGLFVALAPGIASAASGGIFGVDSAAHTQYAADLLLSGRHPYAAFDVQEALAKYPVVPGSVTYNLDGSAMSAYTYPSGAFLTMLPFRLVGLDVRLVYEAASVVMVALVAFAAPPGARLLVLGFTILYRFLSGWTSNAGIAEPYWMALVLAAYLLRGRSLTSGAVMGVALAVKQLPWFFFPIYLIAMYHAGGWRAAAKAGGLAAGLFVAVNLPFALTAPQPWFQGVFGPMLFPLPVLGFGLARLGSAIAPALPKSIYTVLEVAAMGVVALAYWRWGRRAPELALVLPWLPLWFAWRSLSSYFYMLPFAVLVAFTVGAWQRRRAAAQTAVDVTPWGERIAVLAIAMLGLSLAAGYEAGLLQDELNRNALGHNGRLTLAALGVLVSVLALVHVVAGAVGRIGPRLRMAGFGTAIICYALLLLAGIYAEEAYRVDTTAGIHYATKTLLAGNNPYTAFDRVQAIAAARPPKAPPMVDTTGAGPDLYTLPAGSFELNAPFHLLGVEDPRFVGGLFQLILVVLVFVAAPPHLKLLALAVPITAHLPVAVDFNHLLFVSVGQGYSETLWATLLAAAWLLRTRPRWAGACLGLALAVSQLAWWAAPFCLLAWRQRYGRGHALDALRGAAGVVLAVNLPFILSNPEAWALGVFSGPAATLPATGLGVAQLLQHLAGNLAWPLTAASLVALAALLMAARRWLAAAPALAFALAWAPLALAWHTGYAYLFVAPPLVTIALLAGGAVTDGDAGAASTGAPAATTG